MVKFLLDYFYLKTRGTENVFLSVMVNNNLKNIYIVLLAHRKLEKIKKFFHCSANFLRKR